MKPGEIKDLQQTLAIASRVLEASFRPQQVTVRAPAGRLLHVRLTWPGVVIVSDRNDGTEIVRSKPGQPFEVAASLPPGEGDAP